ncbi:tape measure protein [Glaesserella parasuis]|nr:tape measure protein [Glaesserella parasuis]
MSSIAKLNIILDLEAANFEKGMSKSEHQAQQFSRKFQVDMDKATKSAKQFAQRTTEYLENIENAAKNINKNSNFQFFTTLGGYAQAASGNIIKYADSYTELGNRIRLVTKSNDEFVKANAAVFDISLRTNQAISSTSQIYQRFAQNADTLKISQQKISELTETVSKAVAISGASNAASEASLTQFGQALASGILRGQEFNSVVEQTPALAKALADGLGVTIAELRKMANDGKLTTDVLVKGLENAKKSVDHQFSSRIITIGQAFTNLETNITKFVGEMDQAIGASQTSISVLNALAKNVDVLGIGVAALATSWGLYHTQGFLKSRAAIYEQNKAFKAQKVAQATALVTQREKIATLAQETAVRLENTMQSYNANKATMEEIAVTQQRIATEKAKIAVEMQGVSSRAERIALSTQLKALEQQEIQLAQQKIAVDKQQIATKQALKVAYAENAITQSRLTASTVASTAATTVYGRAVAGVKNELNLMKAAALSNPLMTLAMLATTAGSAIWMLSENKKMAREEALRYADSIDQVRINLEQMTKVQVEAELVKVKRSLQEQEAHIDNLKKKQQELLSSTQQTVEFIGQEWSGAAVVHQKSAKEIEKAQEDLKLVTAEAEEAQRKFNKTLEFQQSLQAHIPVSELRDRFAELFPNIDKSQIKVDGMNVSIGNFTMALPSATVEALKFEGAIGSIAKTAIQAAIAVSNLAFTSSNGLSENLQNHITELDSRTEIARLRAEGKNKEANQKQAHKNTIEQLKRDNPNLDSSSEAYKTAYNKIYQSELAYLNTTQSNGGKGSNGGKSHENYLNQVAEMSQRLAELKAEAQDLKFGHPSQYQEVRKLTEDIVINADKYKNISLDGIEKLKSLAAQIDSESQNIAIQKLKIESNEALDAMQFGLTLLGKTRTEQELIQFNHQLDIEANRLKQGMTAENIAKLDEEIAKLKERRAIIQAEAEKMRQDPVVGLRAGLAEFADDATNISGQIQNVVTGSLSSMTDSLNTFVMTGKADFRSLAQSILSDINKMIIKMMIFQSIKMAGKAMGFDMSFMGNIGFATGGYTGDGGKYTPAGIVHRGEYVITKEATSRLGLDYLNYLNYGKRGFATGGGVGVPRMPSTPTHFGGSQNVTVTVINNGKPTSAEVETKKDGQDLAITVKLMEQIADGVYRRNQTRDLRSGGALNR